MDDDQHEELKNFQPPLITFFIVAGILFFSGLWQEHFDVIIYALAFLSVVWGALIYYSDYKKTGLFYIALLAFSCIGVGTFIPLSRSIEGFGPLAYVLIIGWMIAFLWFVKKANLASKIK